jgi:putative tryptophan/tyrosine transport system substrate-binding protein
MDRREFIVLLGSVAGLASPAAADDKKVKIGFLSWFPPTMNVDLDHFREGMQQLGYVDGKNYEVEAYFTGGNREMTQDVARRLVQEPVDVLLAVATPAIHIVNAATHTIPIVMLTANALATGLVSSLSRPGGNLTGVSLLMTDLAGKRLELLREIQPSLHAITFLGSSRDPNTATFVRETQTAADQLGVMLSVRLVDGPASIDQAIFDTMKRDGSEAVIVQPIFAGYHDNIITMAMKSRLPVISDWAFFAEAGALLTYGANEADLMRRTAYYVDRILKGANPADLPIEQPTNFEMVINLKTAKALGLDVPATLLATADRVIE